MSPSDKPSDQVDMSSLFTRKITHGGRNILRPIWFYISLNKNGYAATRRLIINHGGKVSTELGDRKTSKEICLIDPHAKAARDGRPAYSIDYIQSCISARRLLNVEDFRIPPVGRIRRTPPKKQLRLALGQEQAVENSGRQADERMPPDLTQTRDSEVTDDLPCIELPEESNETHETPAINGLGVTGVLLDEAPLSGAGGADQRTVDDKAQSEQHHKKQLTPQAKRADHVTPKKQKPSEHLTEAEKKDTGGAGRGTVDDKLQSEPHHKKQVTPHSERPDHVTPKKRRSSEHITEAGEKDTGTDLQKHPQTVSPVKDSMSWSKKEDNTITGLCVEAKETYRDSNKDPNKVFTLSCWASMEKAGLLPTGRSAKACFERAKDLWKNSEAEAAKTAEKETAPRGNVKRVRISPPQAGGPEDEDDVAEKGDHPQAPLSTQELPARDEVEQEPEILKNASRRETREYIFELVCRIAKRGKVTKRKAFRALREERGHWKRALRLVMRRKGKSDA